MPDSEKITYRRAVSDDLKSIQMFVDQWLSGRAIKEGGGNDYFVTRNQHKAYLKNCVVMLALIDNQIIGWCVKERSNVLIHLLISAKHRGKGIGGKMLEKLKPDIIRSKSDQMTGDPGPFYEKYGYHSIGNKVGKKSNIQFMSR